MMCQVSMEVDKGSHDLIWKKGFKGGPEAMKRKIYVHEEGTRAKARATGHSEAQICSDPCLACAHSL